MKFESVVISGKTFIPQTVISPDAYPYFAYIMPDYKRTSDHNPRTHGMYASTTAASIDYRYMKCYTANVGVPDVINLYDDDWFPLDYSMQWLWMDACCLSLFGRKYKELNSEEKRYALLSWKTLTDGGRAFANGKGWDDGYRDFIIPANIGANLVEQEQVTCSMNKVKVIGEPKEFFSNYLGLGNKKYWHYPIECLNPNARLPDAKDLLTMDWLCHRPTTSSGKNLGGGKYEINNFPQFREKSKVILWGKNGVGWIRSDWVSLQKPS